MPIKKNEIGKNYGDWIVLSKEEELTRLKKRVIWVCECKRCKNKKNISGSDLRTRVPNCPICKKEKLQTSEIGNTYGKFTVIGFSYINKDRHYVWKCKCECGNIEDVIITRLTSKEKTCCNICSKKERKIQYINEKGNKYGKLTVLNYDEKRSGKKAYWICECECGNIISVLGTKLRYGQTSCGCEKSKGEFKINQILSENHINYKTQVSFPDCLNERELRFDFGIYDNENKLKYLIEYDGEQHFKEIEMWGGKDGLEKIKYRDNIKNEYCKNHNIPLIRISYAQYEQLTIKDLIL